MIEEEYPQKITVSREALRAELLALELRLTEKLAGKEEVHHLTDRHEKLEQRVEAKIAWAESLMPLRDKYIAEHVDMKARIDLHERGQFPPAWDARVQTMIDDGLTDRVRKATALRSNRLVWAVGIASIASTVISLVSLFLVQN